MGDFLETVEVVTGAEPAFTVILLHGLGADGHDFEPIVAELRLPFGVRFVFPHAPLRDITINAGQRMRGWYDILGWGEGALEDSAGIRESAAAVTKLIDREVARGMPIERIVLAGFSQGGAIVLHTALREPRPLGGVIALSTYLPLAATLGLEKKAAHPHLAIFMAHGTGDPLIALRLGEASKRMLEEEGYKVEWHAYPMGHTVCAAEIQDIGAWLAALARS